jgi:pimeloyl-ACP methyl ester carboxylesterase
MGATLLTSEQIDTSISGAVAYRIRYRSHDIAGRATESTGLVIAPASAGENRKVMTWCHGTTGLGDASCPSAQSDPASELKTYFEIGSTTEFDYGVPGLQGFIDEGWVVCATDYQGLGTPGRHQYTVGRTNALDAVNIIHATRELPVGAGTRFGAIGWSQGGAAAAAVAELTDADFNGLTVVGSVPMSPGVPVSYVRVPGGLGGALASGDVPPDGHLFMILSGLQAAFPHELNLSDFYTEVGIRVHDAGWNTQPVHHLSDALARSNQHYGPVMQIDKSKLPALMKAITESSASLVKARCPIFVTIDSQHGGSVVPVAAQTQYISDAQALGSEVTSKDYPNDDHFSLPASSIDDARAWLTAQFA